MDCKSPVWDHVMEYVTGLIGMDGLEHGRNYNKTRPEKDEFYNINR